MSERECHPTAEEQRLEPKTGRETETAANAREQLNTQVCVLHGPGRHKDESCSVVSKDESTIRLLIGFMSSLLWFREV